MSNTGGGILVTWEVQLQGFPQDLELASEFFCGKDTHVVKNERGEFILKSTDFEGMMEPDFVLQFANEHTIPRINGILKLKARLIEPLRSNTVYKLMEDGQRTGHVHLVGRFVSPVTIKDTATITEISGNVTMEEIEPLGNRLLRIGNLNQKFGQALELWSNSLNDPRSLYFLLELIESDVGNVASVGWVTQNQRSLFMRSVNHNEVFGVRARHASSSTPPPSSPMSIEQANEFVRSLLDKWIQFQSM